MAFVLMYKALTSPSHCSGASLGKGEDGTPTRHLMKGSGPILLDFHHLSCCILHDSHVAAALLPHSEAPGPCLYHWSATYIAGAGHGSTYLLNREHPLCQHSYQAQLGSPAELMSHVSDHCQANSVYPLSSANVTGLRRPKGSLEDQPGWLGPLTGMHEALLPSLVHAALCSAQSQSSRPSGDIPVFHQMPPSCNLAALYDFHFRRPA